MRSTLESTLPWWIAGPVRKLAAVAKKISAGGLNEPLDPLLTRSIRAQRDEIAELKGQGKTDREDSPPAKRQVKYDRKLKTNVVKRQRPVRSRRSTDFTDGTD